MFNPKKKPEVRVIKIHAYPIEGQILVEGKAPITIAIQRLEEYGCVFTSESGYFFRINDEVNCNFNLPLLKSHINQPVRIIKTAESAEPYASGSEPKKKLILVEVHFKNKSGDFQKEIREYLTKINQRAK
jgi:hypothetical protein